MTNSALLNEYTLAVMSENKTEVEKLYKDIVSRLDERDNLLDFKNQSHMILMHVK